MSVKLTGFSADKIIAYNSISCKIRFNGILIASVSDRENYFEIERLNK